MLLGRTSLYRKMLVTPRLNITCDNEIKIRLAYIENSTGRGWFIENFNNDGKEEWFKGKTTKQIVDMIFEKYQEMNVTWSRSF